MSAYRFTVSRLSRPRNGKVPLVAHICGNVFSTARANAKLRATDQAQEFSSLAADGFDERKAVPYNKSIFSELTPTLRSFTLEGKVAVITG